MRWVLFAVSLVIAAAPVGAIGILIPRELHYSPIRLGKADVRAEINNNIARTRVVQEFENPNPRQLEADFYFPVPRGANVTDFVLYINGKATKGEVLENEKAREIYEGIVRRMADPGLLEWIDYNLFKVRVFPVPAHGTQKIELEFAQPLTADQGLFKYVFPLKSSKRLERAGPPPHVTFEVTIKADEAVRNVYSPTHMINTDTNDPKNVKVTVPATSFGSGGDFNLFYQASNKDVALSLLATRPLTSQDGYFALMLSPKWQVDPAQVTPNDVNFVIDTSGSMLENNKIEQARRALTYCMSQLREQDRFTLTRFATEVEPFSKDLAPATKEKVEEAKAWIAKLDARGGTNISGALDEALELRSRASSSTLNSATTGPTERVYTIVFITDGLPTIGTTNADQIAQEVRKNSGGNVRIFTFGVGHDVNTKLLDSVAEETRAASDYVKPGEDMEVPISKFFDKIARPALVDLKVEIPSAEAYDLYPKTLPDLFFGTQLTVFGRYKKAGPTAIKLTGRAAGKQQEFVYEKTLPEQDNTNQFVENLWGTRKIGYLLDEIRGKGENKELKDEVIQLSKKYGVVTPYTSYLVTEDTPVVAAATPPTVPMPMDDRGRRFSPPRRAIPEAQAGPQAMPGMSAGAASDRAAAGAPMSAQRSTSSRFGFAAPDEFKAESGSSAVESAQVLRKMKENTSVDSAAKVAFAAGRTFTLSGNVWIDTQLSESDQPTLRIKYLSNAYFLILKENPTLKEVFALGAHVRVKLANGILEVGPDGKEELASGDAKLSL